MLASDLKIPEKIKVGFQSRGNTFTGRLAYVTYYDNKGKLRKEASWNGWRSPDLEPEDYDNVPIKGFMLNKNVGGDRFGWNPRNSYIRVYDPRGFEVEITISNLMYILENTNVFKKELEGKFVYSWTGTELVLMPESSPDYKDIKEYSDKLTQNEKVYAKDLEVGSTYLTNKNEEVVYLGRFDKWETYHPMGATTILGSIRKTSKNKGKHHFFGSLDERVKITEIDYKDRYLLNLVIVKSPTSRIMSVVPKDKDDIYYQKLMGLLGYRTEYSPFKEDSVQFLPYTIKELKENVLKHIVRRGQFTCYVEGKQVIIKPKQHINFYLETQESKWDTEEELENELRSRVYQLESHETRHSINPEVLFEGTWDEVAEYTEYNYLEERLANGNLYYSYKQI